MKRFIMVFAILLLGFLKPVYAEDINMHNGNYLQNLYSPYILDRIIILILLIIIITFLIQIIKIKKEILADKMIDPETKIGNFHFFKYHFEHTISDISKNLYHIAYIILDSSYLRSYHGNSSFENVLKHTVSVLSEHTGSEEFTARITENGFAFAFKSDNDEEAKKRIKKIISELNRFEDIKGENNNLVFHSAVYRLGNSDKNCELLLFNLRKNCNRIFGTEKQIIYCDTHSINMVKEEKEIVESFIHGFEQNEFKMYLQFIVDNKTKKIVSAEALSRWHSKNNGVIGPGNYIENMEMTGLISRHDFYMFEIACRQLEKWKNTEFKDISISCNFTRITLSEENFIDNITSISNIYNFDKSKLSIEITEDAMEQNLEIAKQNVKRCKELGFNIYLDDLGSGYTSITNLCDYPIDVVKIDRDILRKTDTKRGKALFTGIISLAHSLGIKVICEGVETEEQNALLSETECDFIQGWYFSKPIPLEECESFIQQYEK